MIAHLLTLSLQLSSVVQTGVEVSPDPTVPSVQLDAITESPSTPPKADSPPAAVADPTTPTEQLVCFENDAGTCNTGGILPLQPPGEPDDEDEPELTEGDVLRAARTIGLPSLAVQVQPGDETLVNVPTIFYAKPRPFARSVDLLGFDVDLTATPIQYVWIHGDGTAKSTTTPGKPYPAMDVTHRYRKPAKNVRPRVDVTYRVRFRVDGGPWQTIGQTLLASGPAAQLEVSEAAPVLTQP